MSFLKNIPNSLKNISGNLKNFAYNFKNKVANIINCKSIKTNEELYNKTITIDEYGIIKIDNRCIVYNNILKKIFVDIINKYIKVNDEDTLTIIETNKTILYNEFEKNHTNNNDIIITFGTNIIEPIIVDENNVFNLLVFVNENYTDTEKADIKKLNDKKKSLMRKYCTHILSLTNDEKIAILRKIISIDIKLNKIGNEPDAFENYINKLSLYLETYCTQNIDLNAIKDADNEYVGDNEINNDGNDNHKGGKRAKKTSKKSKKTNKKKSKKAKKTQKKC
jgi:hypothetical protein